MASIQKIVRATGTRYRVRAVVSKRRVELGTFESLVDAEAAIADAGLPRHAPTPNRKTIDERLKARSIRVESGCLLWTGQLDADMYGRIQVDGRPALVHREAYRASQGQLASAMTIDHTCHNADLDCPGGNYCLHRRCIEPSHLEPVSQSENSNRHQARLAQIALRERSAKK